MVFFRLFCLGIFICIWWYFCGVIDNSKSVVNHVEPQTVQPETTPLETYKRLITYVVKPGDTFLGILTQNGVSSDMAITFHRTLKSLGLMSIFPGDSLVLTLSDNGAVADFSVLSRLQNWYKLTVDNANVKAHKAPVKSSGRRFIVRGVLTSSLSEDLVRLGVGDACVSKLTDIFAWDINFFVDPQPGDSFEVVFEKKYVEGKFFCYGDILSATYVNNGRAFHAIGFKNENEPMQYYDREGKSLQKEFLKAPLRFNHISSNFTLHRRHPILGIVRPHLGIDYAAPQGTPVYSAADGKVAFAGVLGGFGKLVRVSHGGSYETMYGHLSAFARGVTWGARVKQGDCIGYVGSTGLSTGPHLDYRMSQSGRFINPNTVTLPRKNGVTGDVLTAFLKVKNEYVALVSCRFPFLQGCFLIDTDSFANKIKPAISENNNAAGETRAN